MAVLHSQVERVEVVGPRRGLSRPERARPLPLGRPPREGGGASGDRPHLLRGARPEQAGGEGGLRRREAGRLRGAERRGCARALRRRLARPRARHRAQDRAPARPARDQDAGAARRHARRAAHALVRPAPRPPPRRAGPLRGRAGDRDGAGGQVRVARDHLRPRPARPPPARARSRAPHRRALRDARARGAARPHDRDQGPLRRLHHRHARPQPRGGRERDGRPSGRWLWSF